MSDAWKKEGEVTGSFVEREMAIMQKRKPDMVNHPKHYTSHPSGAECIEITRHMSFNIGNAVKYLWRQGLKLEHFVDTTNTIAIRDLEKAVWYINDEIKRLEKLNNQPKEK